VRQVGHLQNMCVLYWHMNSILPSTSTEFTLAKKATNLSDDRQNVGSDLKKTHETDPPVTRECKITE